MATDRDIVLTILIIVVWNGIQYRQIKEQLKIQNEQIRLSFFQDYTNRASHH
ncbi:MAG: hypothetical protein ACXABY_10125 [Candidatus Thorarchaeota archaeon]|jgi:hypothetical protein